jgi:hypothetical protein
VFFCKEIEHPLKKVLFMKFLKSAALAAFLFSFLSIHAADRFWVGGSGNWNNTSNWSTTTGGVGGASVPTSADNVIFDTLSFSAGAQVVTVDVDAQCANMDWTLSTNSPTITGAAGFSITVAGSSFTLIDAMTYSFAGTLVFTNTGGITLSLGNVGKTLGMIQFTGTTTRTIDIDGNGTHSFGRINVNNNATVNFNGSGGKTYNGYFAATNVQTTISGNVTFTDTLSTGYNNAFIVASATTNTYQTVLVGEIDNGSRNHRYQGSNTFNGEVVTANDYENTDRVHFYNSVFNDKVTITAPDGRAQFRSNSVFNDTLFCEANTSVRFFDVDSFKSVVILVDDNFMYLSQSNAASDYAVFEDSVFFGPDMDFRSYRNATFNGPVQFAGNDVNGAVRVFNDGGGTTTFNNKVYFGNGAGSANGRWIFERQNVFNDDVTIGDNSFLRFNDANGTARFNGSLTIGNNNDIIFEQDVDFESLTVGNQNTILLQDNIDLNEVTVFGNSNVVDFCQLRGELDVFEHLTFGEANVLVFHNRVDFGPAAPGDSIAFGRLTIAEFNDTNDACYFEDFYLHDEARATFRNGATRFDNIVINDFSTLELSAGGTNTVVGTFTANESCESTPIVRSGTGGSQATIDFTGAAQNWSNVILQDIVVTTSNLLTIDEAVNNGNLSVLDNTTPAPGPPVGGTTIWITNDRPGTTLYWVGKDGVASGNFNWTNRFNWSTTSNGNGLLNSCLPNAKDNVVFDANSFTAAGQQVVIDASFVACNDMTWTGITAGAELVGNATNTIFILEDLTLDANMVNDFTGGFEFLADDGAARTVQPNGIDFEGSLTFNYTSGNWSFGNDITANGIVRIKDGTVSTSASNYNLTVAGAGNDLIIENSGVLNAGSGTVTVADDLLMTEDAAFSLTSGATVAIGDDVSMMSNASFGHVGSGTYTSGGAITVENDGLFDVDTMAFTVGSNVTLNDDAVFVCDSCFGTIGSSFTANNNTAVTFGVSSLVLGVDVYLQDNTIGSISGGALTCGDDFFLDDANQFTAANTTITVNGDDFFLDDNVTMNCTNTDIVVNGDDWEIQNNVIFTLNGGSIYVDDDFRMQNSAVLTTTGATTFNLNDNADINGGTVNGNGTFIFDVEDNFDMDGGTFNANAGSIFVGANFDIATAATFNAGTATLTMDDDHTNVNIITRGNDLYNLVIDKEDPTSDVRITNNAFVINNNFSILNGDFYDSDESTNGPHQITGNTTGTGTLTIRSTGSLSLGDIDGGSDAPSTFPTGWGLADMVIDDSSEVVYRQRGVVQTISGLPTYGNLTLNNAGGVVTNKVADGALRIEGRFFMDNFISLADSGFQIVGNANAGTEFEMDANTELILGSATTATTLPGFPTRDWDSRSTINYAAGVAQAVVSITGGGNANSYGHLTISNVTGTAPLVDKTLGGAIAIRRELNINAFSNLVDAGNQVTGNNNGDDLTMQSSAQLTIGTALSNTDFPSQYTNANIVLDVNSLVVYNSDIDQDVSATPTYGNLQLSSGSAVVKSLTGNADVDGNLIIGAQNTLTTTGSNFDMSMAGDWMNNGSFSANLGAVTFDGTNLSTISGTSSTSFYDLIVNNTAADSALEITVQTNVINHLTLTNGVISTSTGNELVIFDDATTSSGSNASHVDGPLRKIGDESFVFPVGDNGKWARLGISNLINGPSPTDEFTAQYLHELNPNAFWDSVDYAGDYDDLHNTSVVEYWNLERNVGASQPQVSLYWSDNAESYINDTSELVVAHYVGGNTWVNEGGHATGGLASGLVTTTGHINSFSPFTFGSVTGGTTNPLPIDLLSFEASVEGEEVRLEWITLSEVNNDYFIVERSGDARQFEALVKVDGAGNSTAQQWYVEYDHQPLSGFNYYRLKQYDFNGKIQYSETVAVHFQSLTEIGIYPNPSNELLRYLKLPQKQQPDLITVTDQLGRPIDFEWTIEDDQLNLRLNTSRKRGWYTVRLHYGPQPFSYKLIVI